MVRNGIARNRAITFVLAAAMVFGLAACGDDTAADQPNETATENAEDTATNENDDAAADADAASPGSEVDLEEAKEFVRITACEGAPAKPMGVSATVEVINPLDEAKEYYGAISFVDGSGAVLTDGVFNTGTIEPGAKATEEIPGANVYEAVPEVTCELTEVKADNPS